MTNVVFPVFNLIRHMLADCTATGTFFRVLESQKFLSLIPWGERISRFSARSRGRNSVNAENSVKEPHLCSRFEIFDENVSLNRSKLKNS